MVSDPAAAFADLLGYVAPAGDADDAARDLLASLRPSVLDAVAREYDLLAPQLGADGRQKLDAHRDLVRELEASLGRASAPAREVRHDVRRHAGDTRRRPAVHEPRSGSRSRAISRASSTFSAPGAAVPGARLPGRRDVPRLRAPVDRRRDVVRQTYSPIAAQAMTDLDAWHAGHVAVLLEQLDSVAEGSGTLLDHTVVVWVTELATPTHLHHDKFTVLAGGCNGFFETGRYVRYPRNQPNPLRELPAHRPGAQPAAREPAPGDGPDATRRSA